MYQYTRHGFLVGIPARDLSDEEAEKFGIEKLLKSGLYVHVDDKQKPKETVYSRRRRAAEVSDGRD